MSRKIIRKEAKISGIGTGNIDLHGLSIGNQKSIDIGGALFQNPQRHIDNNAGQPGLPFLQKLLWARAHTRLKPWGACFAKMD